MLPPFPSQDLAKLVLGYLAEEQLMVAYDEFLHASPYLDALQNEYDRIFMTSLRIILAEYRAVKIYVETCKPFMLRKKLFQCTNLLDIVKFLVNHVDINKIQLEETAERASFEKQANVNPKANTCEICMSLKLVTCTCKTRITKPPLEKQSSNLQAALQNSVETTPLADLPGNHVIARKKQVKVLDKEAFFNYDGQSDGCMKESLLNQASAEDKTSCHSTQPNSNDSIVSLNSTIKESEESKEFDTVLESVVTKNKTVSGSQNVPYQRLPNTNAFHDFASGVTGGREVQNANVPDSSTSENITIRDNDYYCNNIKGPQNCKLLLQVTKSNTNENNDINTRSKDPKFIQINPNVEDLSQKIKIISDVKVTNKFNKGKDTKKKMAMKNATSTPLPLPLMQMQTIVINGTTAYKHPVKSQTYTKEEIMAMPTLIVVPASGAPSIPTSTPCQTVMTKNSNVVSAANSTSRPLSPLVIDVPPTPTVVIQPKLAPKVSDTSVKNLAEADLLRTFDIKNASVPKDTVSGPTSNTPHMLPPVRKSSSTPRRTTHVRVLDFATPRRILHETNEQVTTQSSDAPVETILSSSPSLALLAIADNSIVTSHTPLVYSNADLVKSDGCDTDNGSAKENNTTKNVMESKKNTWDNDLRALVANDHGPGPSKRKNMNKNTKKKKKPCDKITECTEQKNRDDSKKLQKSKTKRRQKNIKEQDGDDEPMPATCDKPEVHVKPTINIICGKERTSYVPPEVKDTNKEEVVENRLIADKDDDCIETPEGERLSLQNMIGVKLNISDLLETPYKQALYDIQMGTPRFLAPDLPDDPLSDIKIMSIPTPRFLDTPKPAQTTPSYATRPSDYSSGGSYYKPDDQDNMPIPDLRCVVSSSSKEDLADKFPETVSDDDKKSRPQRQCTKNVSYYKFGNNKKEAEVDVASSCSDSNAPVEHKHKETVAKTPRERSKSTKSESTKKSKKKKSPAVREKFIKIKPRQTPTKATPSRNRKKGEISRYVSPHVTKRNRTTSKDKNECSTPLVVPVPTKSRRKSSTPRKLHCGKSFNTESSPETIINTKKNASRDPVVQAHDSESEKIALRWSDDGSQDTKGKTLPTTSMNECEDISKIQEYIQTTGAKIPENEDISNIRAYIQNTDIIKPESEGSLQADLIKRGFDSVTAEKIERDLLDTPPPLSDFNNDKPVPLSVQVHQKKTDESIHNKTQETDSSATNDLQIVQDESDDEEFELSGYECNEDSDNYIVFSHDDAKDMPRAKPTALKDTYSMEVCVDDGVTVRVRATPFSVILDQDPITVEEIDYTYKETEMAVNSISNMDRLYTPLKDSIKAQCYEIFDSTLTSLDTPLKAISPKIKLCDAVTEIVSDQEQVPGQAESSKRKRSTDSQESDSKKTKYLLTSARIQNIDIESVLTKLHGP